MSTHSVENSSTFDVLKGPEAIDKGSVGNVNAMAQELTKSQAKRLLLKTDLVVMPLAIISMTLAFLDKARCTLHFMLLY